MSIRSNFPSESEEILGGLSDGLVFSTIFAGTTYANSYQMILEFLKEEGFENLPVPKDFDELKMFRTKCLKNQLKLFDDIGYQHFPIKILFPELRKYPKKALLLKIYNEDIDDNLLRFFGLKK